MLKSTETIGSISAAVIGNLIYEETGKITGTRVVNVEEPKIEFSYTSEGILKGEIGVTNIGTYWVIPKSSASPGVMYGEARGVISTKEGGELAVGHSGSRSLLSKRKPKNESNWISFL